MYDAVYLLTVVIVLGCVALELARMVYVEQVVRVVNEGLVANLLAVVVYENVPHDSIYPPFEVGVWCILVHVGQSLQGRLLQ